MNICDQSPPVLRKRKIKLYQGPFAVKIAACPNAPYQFGQCVWYGGRVEQGMPCQNCCNVGALYWIAPNGDRHACL
jgi:hypothetical protein